MPIIHDAQLITRAISYTVTIKNGLYCEVNVAPQIIFARQYGNAAHPAQLRHEATKWAIKMLHMRALPINALFYIRLASRGSTATSLDSMGSLGMALRSRPGLKLTSADRSLLHRTAS